MRELFRRGIQPCDAAFIFKHIRTNFVRRRTLHVNSSSTTKDDQTLFTFFVLGVEVQGHIRIFLNVFELMCLCLAIDQEGIIIPPLKLVEAGRMNEAALALIVRNSRTPDERRGDLAAFQRSSC